MLVENVKSITNARLPWLTASRTGHLSASPHSSASVFSLPWSRANCNFETKKLKEKKTKWVIYFWFSKSWYNVQPSRQQFFFSSLKNYYLHLENLLCESLYVWSHSFQKRLRKWHHSMLLCDANFEGIQQVHPVFKKKWKYTEHKQQRMTQYLAGKQHRTKEKI